MKKIIILLFALISFALDSSYAQTPKLAFPQNKAYFNGCILPSTKTRKELNTATTEFYTVWKKAYLCHDCADARQYYILNDEGNVKGKGKTICVSEGQGYGMQIMVLMAGEEKEAQAIFDGMYRFARMHPSSVSKYLMSWSILKGCVTNKHNDNNNSATDGDMDIAISLLMADNQWGSTGTINYREEARKSIGAILKHEINGRKHSILLCDANTPDDPDYNDIRSSDFMPAYLRVFNNFFPNPEWKKVIDNTYIIFANIQQTYGAKTGLIPDFISYSKGKYSPAKPNYLEGPFDGNYYYNACRVPFRVGLDYLLFGDERAKNLLDPLSDFIKTTTTSNAENVCAGYYLSGKAFANHDFATPAYVCPFAIGAMLNKNHQDWLDNCWNSVSKFEFKDYQYFDNTLQLLSMIVLSGNYWLPQP